MGGGFLRIEKKVVCLQFIFLTLLQISEKKALKHNSTLPMTSVLLMTECFLFNSVDWGGG